ncbi:hypothetical protein [Salipaludibacillus daqingensis]|uniref:hypothetical protein n=1 Tax=Salipaludibacillus daqingensis TaxID=3041001 RepID=UPI0024751370|nr:hypothetical protein [Salipaludibacillus daqingensis]
MQTEAQRISEEMKQLKINLALMENHLQEIQLNCQHDYTEGPLYKQCSICLKVEAFHF